MISPEVVAEIVLENVRKFENPLGLKNSEINNWGYESAKKDGEWFLFTGMLYQLMPIIEKATQMLKIFNSNAVLRASRKFSKTLVRPVKNQEVENILRNIYSLLVASGVDVYYIPELDTYSGILLYDLCLEDEFEEFAKLVAQRLEGAGVEKVVTVDPHTYYALKELYPKFVGKSFEVVSYIELLDGKIFESREGRIAIHDPCYYGRYLKVSEKIRDVIRSTRVKFKDVQNSHELTSCCGGPAESIYPRLAESVAKIRLRDFGDEKIVTSCPICLINLRRAGGVVEDLSTFLKKCSSV